MTRLRGDVHADVTPSQPGSTRGDPQWSRTTSVHGTTDPSRTTEFPERPARLTAAGRSSLRPVHHTEPHRTAV